MTLLTTSRRPTRRIRSFSHDLARVIPNTILINRGKISLQELAENAIESGSNRIIVIDRWKGGPGSIRLYRIDQKKLVQVPPQIYVKGIKLQREFKKESKKIDSLMMSGQPSEPPSEITMFSDALSKFFDVPIRDIGETGSNWEAVMRTYRDDGQTTHVSFFRLPEIVEIGPHITISYIKWKI